MKSRHRRECRRASALSTVVLALAFAAASASACLGQTSFQGLGDLAGGEFLSVANGVSADGRFVVGHSSSTGSGASSTEAFRWSEETGMIGLGDLAITGVVESSAADVSADGAVVVGYGTAVLNGSAILAFRWTESGGMENLFSLGGGDFTSRAAAVSSDGSIVVGSAGSSRAIGNQIIRGVEAFHWTREQGMVGLGFLGTGFSGLRRSSATDISPDGAVIVGSSTFREGSLVDSETGFRFESARLVAFDQVHALSVFPGGTSAGGEVTVARGSCLIDPSDPLSRRPAAVTYHGLDNDVHFICETDGLVDVDASGRVAVSRSALFVEGKGPVDLATLLERFDVLPEGWSALEAKAISDDGLTVVGFANNPDRKREAWRARFADCNDNGVPDEVELEVFAEAAAAAPALGTELFQQDRENVGFQSMIAAYGRPWRLDTGQTPAVDDADLASRLRAVVAPPGCASVAPSGLRNYYLESVLSAAHELHSFEMLLGNEAYADALDPTIGLDGIPAAELGDHFAFRGVPGIRSLLDEELALLRGRAIDDPLDDDVRYPELSGAGGEPVRAAVYNRLPPNADGGFASVAYRSNYKLADGREAALAYPQGHGDAYGYYLRALKASLDVVRADPPGVEGLVQSILDAVHDGEDDFVFHTLGDLADAMTARARAAARIVGLTFRRDYREDPADPRRVELFADPDPERAWSTAEWARRGALGAYLDWAVLNQLTPPGDDLDAFERESAPEFGELALFASEMQERVDAAGAGLDPLGLVQNVVPFGIDAASLDSASGSSHYEQVRDAANRALENARRVFELANQGSQRLREQEESRQQFGELVADTKAEFNERLVELFGSPSVDDPADNDLDPSTDDFEESQLAPDLVNFFFDDPELERRGMAPRPAVGQIQLALSELRVADLRVHEAELALDRWTADVESLVERIELLVEASFDRDAIIWEACAEQIDLTRRLEDIKDRDTFAALTSDALLGFAGLGLGAPELALDFVKNFSRTVVQDLFEATDDHELKNEFDVEVERQRVQCEKESRIVGLESELAVDAEQRQLAALLGQSAQLLVNRAIAGELSSQATGRMRSAAQLGARLFRERQRIDARLRGELEEQRFEDMAFRVFRNSTLEKYGAFYELAQRYVVLAARAYAYEFNARAEGENVLAGIYRERRLGSASGATGGLQEVLQRLDNSVVVNNFNRPLESLGQRTFSLRANLLGIGADDFPNDDISFREFVEGRIVQRLEDLPVMRDFAQISVQRDAGPAIVIPFKTEIDGRNFFGEGPEPPFGNANFSLSRNPKIRSYAVRFDGVEADLGIDPEEGGVSIFLIPIGESVLRENTNRSRIEDELPRPWPVVDQFLPSPPLVTANEVAEREFSPWRTTAQAGGNFLNSVKRFLDARGQLELGQEFFFNTSLAGRSAWNTRWLLVVPGGQWTSSSDPAVIRRKLVQFIYGSNADPRDLVGLTDIRLIIQAYTH